MEGGGRENLDIGGWGTLFYPDITFCCSNYFEKIYSLALSKFYLILHLIKFSLFSCVVCCVLEPVAMSVVLICILSLQYLPFQSFHQCMWYIHPVTRGTSTSMAGLTRYFEWFFHLLARCFGVCWSSKYWMRVSWWTSTQKAWHN